VAEHRLRIAVFGSGAVGGYFGGRLAEAGEDVVFLARGDHLRAIRSGGLRVSSVAGDFLINPAQVTDDPTLVGPVDAIMVCVKAWQVREAAAAIVPMIGPETAVVPLENGIDGPAELRGVVGAGPVLGGLCRILSSVSAPGHVRHTGVEPYVAFGELDTRRSRRAERLLGAFARARGVTAEIPEDIRAAMWRKFLLIAAWSGVGAVTRAPIGVIRTRPETRQLLEQALREIHAVAVAHRVPLPESAIPETLAFLDAAPADGVASMQRDIVEGRPSELGYQSGAVVRLGREAGVPVPVHTFIYQSLIPLELRSRGEIRFESA
jgi:2-dehydropantoate 2-reductase